MINSVNPKHKDRLFRFLFGSMEVKDNIISLYNAINNTAYTVDDITQITTLDDVIYIKMKNDVSLLIDDNLTLWEQQSSFNPNMPLTRLMYLGNLYQSHINDNDKNIYSSKLVSIPTPQYIVFYNGNKDTEPITKLKLSDAFINKSDSNDFEWTATMYNLNKGNEDILNKCKPLSDYVKFISYIKEYQGMGLAVKEAVDNTINRCIKEGIMSEFLVHHKGQVADMVLTEFDEEKYIKLFKAEGFDEGLERGLKATVTSLKDFTDDPSVILNCLHKNEDYRNITLADIEKYL